ncbi:uncharacterized protein LOC113353717 [Papaver somniferum]|uniref:uncharacterized protein LOC113353717 n=1 Tax=Papaver somniferum TaxID=3469 RepID=UPI000E6F6A72|nr:uncharacterized protein LOC113353717 [Papaver somniferum]
MEHLKYVFSLLGQHKLLANFSKCCFGQSSLEYLGHTITTEGVSANPNKISCMQQWPLPTTIKELRGFLGLTGYYRKFVKGYLAIAKPLTELLKKNSFNWSPAATLAFNQLKEPMKNTPILALPDFIKPFVVESDASDLCVGVFLLQENKPIAYFSKPLGPKAQALSTYEKEFMAIVLAGVENVVADALSRRPADSVACNSISVSAPTWVQDFLLSYSQDAKADQLISQLLLQANYVPHFTFKEGILRYKNRIYIGTGGNIRHHLLESLHASVVGGHSAWQHITMDFINGMPISDRKSILLVIVDKLTKYAHFIPLHHPYTAVSVAQVFLNQVFKLHGLPSSIVSDRDKVFTSNFWQDLFKATGTKLNLSTTYHPQTDSQTERVNACLENYLRCIAGHKPSS